MLYPDTRVLLAVMSPHAPEALRFTGMVLYITAPAAAVVFVMTLIQFHRHHHHRVSRRLLAAAIASVVVLVAYAIRFGVSAYHSDSLVLVNNVAVHVFYIALFVFLVLFMQIVRKFPDRTRSGSPRCRRYFAVLQLVGLYLYGVGILAFWVTRINLYIRLVELGVVTVLFCALVILNTASAVEPRRFPAVKRISRHVTGLTILCITLSAIALILRETDVLPGWIDPALIVPAYAITLSGDLAVLLSKSPAPRRLSAPTGEDPQKQAQNVFFRRLVQDYGITPQEERVLELVMRGKSNRSIAELLGITEKTVRNHVSSLYRKTESGNRVELVHVFELP